MLMGQYVQSLQESIFLGLLKIREYYISMPFFKKIVWTNKTQGCNRSLIGQQL